MGGHKLHSQSGAAGPGTCARLPATHYTLSLAHAKSHASPAPRCQPYPLPQRLRSSLRAHMAYFVLSPVPYCSGNSSCLLHLTYVPVAGQDFSEFLTTNCSHRCASPWDSRVTSCLPHATKLRLHHHPGIFLLLAPKQCQCSRAIPAGSQPATYCVKTERQRAVNSNFICSELDTTYVTEPL